MTRRKGDLEMRLRGMTLPALPEGLKHRVMAEARLAPVTPWLDRVWYLPTWRLAAAGILLAVLAIDRWSADVFRADAVIPSALASDERMAVDAVGTEVGMPPEVMERLAARAEFVPLTARETRGQAMRASVDTELR
jgi:hypothetical protein